MAILTGDVHLRHYGSPTKIEVPAIEADTFYQGALVFADATNGKAQASDTAAAGDFFLGLCARQITTTAADQLIEIYIDGVWGFPISGTTAATDMGRFACVDASAITDNPADVVSSNGLTEAANDILIGLIVSVHSSRAWVNIAGPHPLYEATAPAAFRLVTR